MRATAGAKKWSATTPIDAKRIVVQNRRRGSFRRGAIGDASPPKSASEIGSSEQK
jgi:hypothetical protein